MKLPNLEAAQVPKAKVCDYLLSPAHSTGRGKARWFLQFGFVSDSWETLADALRRHATEHDIASREDSPFGIRYIIEGPLICPDGRSPLVRSVWFIESGEDVPRLVTAYPLRRNRT